MTGYSKSAIYRSHSSNNYSGGYSLLEQIDDKSPTFRGLPPPSSLSTLSSGGRIDQSLALCLLLLMGILVCVAAKARPASSNPADWRCLFWWLEEGRILDWFPNPKRTQLCYNPRGLGQFGNTGIAVSYEAFLNLAGVLLLAKEELLECSLAGAKGIAQLLAIVPDGQH